MKTRKTIFYEDELNEEFSEAKIIPKKIDENYKYLHNNFLWNFLAFIFHCVLLVPIRIIYVKFRFKIKYVGKNKFKNYKKNGFFIYANHTQDVGDTAIPSIPLFPKRNYFIVNPENVSMKFLGNFVAMLGAIPIPNTKYAMKNFLYAISKRCEKHSITIYPEAHIWPYYTKIRPFKSVSFRYPIEYNKPAFCMTNTYQKYKNTYRIVTYIDGPFFADSGLSKNEAKHNLRNKIYNCMVQRSKNSNFEYIKYVKK